MAERVLPGNWLEWYKSYTSESESPELYHTWVGLSVVAGVLRRRVWFDMGYFPVYPNLYVVLVGPPGRCKKSTAQRIGRGILQSVPGIDFTTDSTTRESLIRDLSLSHKDGMSAMTAYSSEFASLLTSSGIDMIVFLTDIFDSPAEWSHKTKAGGKDTIKAPYLNLCGATTPDWISKAMPLDTVGIGLTSRIIFVFQDTPRGFNEPFPVLNEGQKALAKNLQHDLISIGGIGGQYTLNADAYATYARWCKERGANPNPTYDPRLDGYYERKPVHLIKLAMVVAAARHPGLIITNEDLVYAMDQFTQNEILMPRVFTSVGRNPVNTDREGIMTVIERNGGATLAELLEKFSHNVSKKELLDIMDTLISMRKVTEKAGRYINIEPPPIIITSSSNGNGAHAPEPTESPVPSLID